MRTRERYTGRSSVYVLLIESFSSDGGSGMRSDDLCPGTTANPVLWAWVVSVPGSGRLSTGELTVGVQSPCIAMDAAQPAGEQPHSGTALTCPSAEALVEWPDSAAMWTGVLECLAVPCAIIAALMPEGAVETAGAPLTTCIPMMPPIMASTTANNPHQRRRDPAVGRFMGKSIVGPFCSSGRLFGSLCSVLEQSG